MLHGDSGDTERGNAEMSKFLLFRTCASASEKLVCCAKELRIGVRKRV